jgi:hypothetical protein
MLHQECPSSFTRPQKSILTRPRCHLHRKEMGQFFIRESTGSDPVGRYTQMQSFGKIGGQGAGV